MEGLLVLLGLVCLAIPIAVLYLLISHQSLKSQVRNLEREVTRLSLAQPKPSDSPPERAPARAPETAPGTDESVLDAPPASPPPPDAAKVIAARRAKEQRIAQSAESPKAPRAPTLLDRLLRWLAGHWIYAVSALSLALAGLFLLQYGVESGWFPPAARVLAAALFGAGLIAGGEVIRRRFGDGVQASTVYLPSVFSGAGLVSLFGAVVAARLLYGLIGVELTFVGLAAVGGLGLVLGWLHGPLLAAVGVIGAFASPFLVGSDVPPTPWLYVYFGCVAALGLGIDTLRRWAWVSGISVALGFATGTLVYLADATVEMAFGLQVYVAVIAVLAILVPARSLWPDHAGPTVLRALVRPKREWPSFPVVLAFVSIACASFGVAGLGAEEVGLFWTGVGLLGLLTFALIFWSVSGPGLQDAAGLPVAGLLGLIVIEGLGPRPVATQFAAAFAETSEAAFPRAVSILMGLGLAISGMALWRALRPGLGVAWAISTAVTAPAVAVALEMAWTPSATIGAYAWALHGAILAGVMTQCAVRFARADGAERLRASLCVLSALAAVAFSLVLILSASALTVALAATVVAAAALDRRFDLPLMQVFIALGVVAVGARLIAEPGLIWAVDQAALWELLLAYGGALAAFVAALSFLRGKDRTTAQVMLDTGAWSAGGVLATLIVMRAIEWVSGSSAEGHWEMGIFATIWLLLALTQLQRFEALEGPLSYVRAGLATLFGLIAAAWLLLALTLFNPLLDGFGGPVLGVALLNTLVPAYGLPSAVLVWGGRRLRRAALRLTALGAGCALAAFWVFAALRHVWQGAETLELRNGFLQGELWSYTLVLLALGAALFYQSLARRSAALRRAGLVVIGLAVAKVFLVDISGLTGLTRVLSFAVLGLSLAALAWLDRWAQGRTEDPLPE